MRKYLRITVLSAGLVAGTGGAIYAQGNAPGGDAGRTTETRESRGFDWGWLGLLGLLGLGGLMRRNHDAHREHTAGRMGA